MLKTLNSILGLDSALVDLILEICLAAQSLAPINRQSNVPLTSPANMLARAERTVTHNEHVTAAFARQERSVSN